MYIFHCCHHGDTFYVFTDYLILPSQYLLSFLPFFGINGINLTWTLTTVTKKRLAFGHTKILDLSGARLCACDKKREISCDVICSPTGHNINSVSCVLAALPDCLFLI